MTGQRKKYTRRIPALRTIGRRDLGNGCRCNLLKNRDGLYQVIFRKGKENFYLVDDITQYDPRTIEDAFYRIVSAGSFECFEKEREDLILDESQMMGAERLRDLEEAIEFGVDPFADAEEMFNPRDED